MIQKTFSFKYVLDFASRFHSRQTRTVKSLFSVKPLLKNVLDYARTIILFFEPVEKYPSFKNKSVCIRFNLFASIFLLILNFCFAQQTYNLEVIFKKTHEPTTWYEGFGQALSSAVDVNNDGYDDILIGSPSGEVRGRCYLYFGGSPMDTLVDMIFYGDTAGDGFAVSVCSGFLNGDSFPDVVVGLPNGWVDGLQPGKVYVYFGGPTIDTLPDMVFTGENHAEAFGHSVASGDINGDGSDDLVVGACYYPGMTLDGRVYVYYGGVLLDTFPDVIISGHNGEAFGKSVGSGGDLNSDGYEDIVVGADENSEAYPGAGKVYVFLGGDPMDTIPNCWLHGEGATHYLGWWGVAMSEATNNYDMVITGTRSYPGGFPGYYPGKVYVLYGGSPMDTIVDLWKVGETDSSWLGNWVDGTKVDSNTMYGDFLAGAPIEYQFDGRGYLWLGNNNIDSIYDAYLQGNINYSGIGWKVASAGDVNGDGFDEVMFSNYVADSNQTVWVCKYTGQGIEQARSQSQEARFEVYPNPFSKLINISFGRVHGAKGKGMSLGTMHLALSVRMYDIAGKEVMVYEIKDKASVKLEIDTKDLPCGVYFLQVESGGESVIRKVVKVR